jgi:segregation and condensation protein A
MTVAVTVFALLELYKRGEAWWEQGECFGEVAVHAASVASPFTASPLAAPSLAAAPAHAAPATRVA